MLEGPSKNVIFQKNCKHVYLFYIHGDTGWGILNVFETNKHFNTMKTHLVVQIQIHILAIDVLKTTALFIKDHPVFFVEKRSS